MPRALKVFRTPIGFHDAYVAVPSKKAALEAWGSSANLFARGLAEEVTDAKLTEAPLAAPGEVVKVPRGTTAEHVAALGKSTPAATRTAPAAASPMRVAKPKPRPSRAKLEAAEAALGKAEAAQAAARDALAARERALAEQRRALERAQAAERAKLEQARDTADAAYARALERWRG